MLQGISEGKGYVDMSTVDIETSGDVHEVIYSFLRLFSSLKDDHCFMLSHLVFTPSNLI